MSLFLLLLLPTRFSVPSRAQRIGADGEGGKKSFITQKVRNIEGDESIGCRRFISHQRGGIHKTSRCAENHKAFCTSPLVVPSVSGWERAPYSFRLRRRLFPLPQKSPIPPSPFPFSPYFPPPSLYCLLHPMKIYSPKFGVMYRIPQRCVVVFSAPTLCVRPDMIKCLHVGSPSRLLCAFNTSKTCVSQFMLSQQNNPMIHNRRAVHLTSILNPLIS